MRVHVADHQLIAHKLTYLRDERTDSPTFRRLAEELGDGFNARVALGDPTAHAEIMALRAAAAAVGTWRLDGCTMVVTMEPCVMCAGALVAARLARVVFGAWDEKAGACGSVWDLVRDRMSLHVVDVVPGVRAQESAALLRDFFVARRSP